jgi:tetratricopeptide (TPR) repeat protein
MADVYVGRANRPTSAVEKTRSVREGGTMLRPASAGVWRGKPTNSALGTAKDRDLLTDMTSEESATSRSYASEASQQGAVQGLRDRVGKASVSRASSASSTNSIRRTDGDTRKKGTDVWMVAPIHAPPAGRQGWGEDNQAEKHSKWGSPSGGRGDGSTNYLLLSERIRKLTRLPSEKDRNRLQRLEESLQAAASGGRSAKPYLDILERLGRLYNSIAMQYLQQGEHSFALILLQSAESLISESVAGIPSLEPLKGLTYNNLGCYFRREGMPMEALKWLRQAHDIEQRVGQDSSRSSTFLNLCAVYSLLGKHLEALQCATQALKHLKAVLQRNPDASLSATVPGMEKVDTASMLAIAYHNIAVEQEYLSRFDEAVGSYRKALEVAETQCGSSSQLAGKIRLALAAADNAAQAAACTSLDTETSVASLESRAVGEHYASLAGRGGARKEQEARASSMRERTSGSEHGQHRDKSREETDMTIQSMSMDSLSEAGSGGAQRKEAQDRLPSASAGKSVGGKSVGVKADRDQRVTVQNESSLGSERSRGSGSSRERSKRPLSAARLPTNDASSSVDAPVYPPQSRVKRHSRKTARPRTAGRERMADQDREELLAMTDPSSSDAGEYEAVADDAALSDNESQAAWQSGNKSWESGQEGGEGASVFGGKSQEAESWSKRRSGRPMSASRPADSLLPTSCTSQARTRASRKTARPRTAGRERMRETDREDLLVLSSASEDGGSYEYLSEGDDDAPHRGSAVTRVEDRASGKEVRVGRGTNERRSESSSARVDQGGGEQGGGEQGGVGKRRGNRPLSAGVSFNSPSNVVHMIRPQSAPAVRLDGRPVAGARGARGARAGRDSVDEDEDEDEEEDDEEEILDSDAEQDGRVPFVAPEGAALRLRPLDSGQIRVKRVSPGSGKQANSLPKGSLPKGSLPKGAALPALLRESDDEADEEELDTKGILLQQTQVLTAELEKSKQRERELYVRLSRLEDSRAQVHVAEKKQALLPGPTNAPRKKPAFGLPEAGLDVLDGEDAPDDKAVGVGGMVRGEANGHAHKPILPPSRALPPRPTNSVSRARSKTVNGLGADRAGTGAGDGVDDIAEIRELTASLRIAAHYKSSGSMPSSPAPSSSSSVAGTVAGTVSGKSTQWKPPAGLHDMLAKPPALPSKGVSTLPHNNVTLDATRAGEGESTRPPPFQSSSGTLNHDRSAAWSEQAGSKARSVAVPTQQAASNGDMSDSSRASSVSRPAALRPLPASRRRRQKAEASRAAQLERAAAQTLQDAWRAHVARARVERRRALSRRRAAKAASAGAHAHPPRRAHVHEADRRQESRRYESQESRKYESRSGASERGSGRSRQQSASAQILLVSEDKGRRAAALRLQRVVRGWQVRRLVEETMGWSLGHQACRRGRDSRYSSKAHDGSEYRRRPPSTAAHHDSELASRGVGRQTPLHSTGVGEESLEGLLQDLGL